MPVHQGLDCRRCRQTIGADGRPIVVSSVEFCTFSGSGGRPQGEMSINPMQKAYSKR